MNLIIEEIVGKVESSTEAREEAPRDASPQPRAHLAPPDLERDLETVARRRRRCWAD